MMTAALARFVFVPLILGLLPGPHASAAGQGRPCAILGFLSSLGPPPPTAPATQPAPAPPEPQGHAADAEADALLDELEKSAADLKGFTAKVHYQKEDALLGRREIRRGEILYHVEDDGSQRFAILFDTEIIGNRRENRLKHYVFDGRWLAEIDHERKQLIKYQIVAPGEKLDPLKLGEGPFPLPVGQPKAQVLARFEVRSIPPPKEGLLAKLDGLFNLQGLRLVPRPGTPETRDYERIDLFYDRATLLPVGVELIETGGNRKTVRLTEPVRNPVFDAAELKKLQYVDPDPREWTIVEQPWAGEKQ